MKRRVVITGIGIKSPLGNTYDDFSENLFAMNSGLKSMDCWDNIVGLTTKVAGIVSDIDEKIIPRANRRSMDRGSILAALSSKDALEDAKLTQEEISNYKTGIAYGSTVGGASTLEKVFGDLRTDSSYMKQTSMDFLKYISNTVCANLSSYFNIKGVSIPICSACTSSSQAIYKLFQDQVPVSSTKGQLGHTLGACGAIESIATICSLSQNKLPSNVNLETLDEACASLDYITEVREQDVNIILKNNFAFGGINTSLIFKQHR